MSRTLRTFLLAIVVIPVLAVSTVQAEKSLAHRHPQSMEQWVKSAKSKADHEALAAHYEGEAKSLDKQAAQHSEMARVYAQTDNPKLGGDSARHCEAIAKAFQDAANENRALAQMHRNVAAGVK